MEGLMEGRCDSAGLIRERWCPPGRRPHVLQALHSQQLTHLPRQRSMGTRSHPDAGCRTCPDLLPVRDGSSEHPGGKCAQAEKLLCLATELRVEVSRLRSIRQSEETDYWNHAQHPWDRPSRQIGHRAWRIHYPLSAQQNMVI